MSTRNAKRIISKVTEENISYQIRQWRAGKAFYMQISKHMKTML